MDRGNEAMVTMTNLTIGEFMEIYSDVESEINIIRRGPKPKISPKDSLFMTLVMLKGFFKWEMLSNLFSVKIGILEKTIKATLESIQPILVQKYIQNIPKDVQDTLQISFPNFANCIQVVDVCFQPIQKPSGSFSSKKKFFSGKHYAYGVKVECTHAPNGQLMRFTSYYPGSTHDFKIFKENINHHLEFLRNGDTFYGLIADLGYIGIQKFIPTAIVPKRKPKLESEREFNRKIGSDQVICENFYGRNKILWNILSATFRWDLREYDTIFGVCSAITNYLLQRYPLRNDEHNIYHGLLTQFKAKQEEISLKTSEKRKRERRNRNNRNMAK